MGLDLIVTIIAGIAVAGCAMLLRRMTGGRLPGWTVPAAAGLGMLSYAIWAEYSWYDRITEKFPDTVEVVAERADPTMWRPWPYLVPFVSGFIAVDKAAVRRHPEAADMRLTEVMIFDRMTQGSKVPALIDCAGPRRADIADGATFRPDGTVEDASWSDVPRGDPLVAALCPSG